MTRTATTKSFLKWVGGKSRTAGIIAGLAPQDGYETYYEPFCGSAAVFFALDPDQAVITDANEDLTVCLREVAFSPDAVMAQLDQWPNTREHYNHVRAWEPDDLDPIVRAARVIYLNKTGFRGLWRVNKQGRFNTPWGAYKRPYYNRDTLLAASRALSKATIDCRDYQEVLLKVEPGDWVYLDPPYVPDRKWGDFNRYTPERFDAADQEELARRCDELDRMGARWLLTNSDTDTVRELYKGWHTALLPTRRDVALAAKDRDSRDLLISNYALPSHPAVIADT